MSSPERVKIVAFTAIVALAGLLIVIIGAHTLFTELFLYSVVMILIGVIVVLVVYAFLWERTSRYFGSKLQRRKMNRLAQEYFDDFRDSVDDFTSLREFRGISQGITGILQDLLKKATKANGTLINKRIEIFGSILQEPLHSFKERLRNMHWNKKVINYEFLSCLSKEFENYVMLHKRLYVDFVTTMAGEIDDVAEATKRSYSDYKGDYNQFIIAYTEFAKRCSKARLGIFNQNLGKAREL